EFAMCDKCSTINKTIERFRQIRRSISDQLTVERARQVIAELEEQKAALHLGDCEPITGTTRERIVGATSVAIPLLKCQMRSRDVPVRSKKDNVMSRRENDATNISRPSDSPLNEYEKEQVALRRNLQRLKAERLAREAENSTPLPINPDLLSSQ